MLRAFQLFSHPSIYKLAQFLQTLSVHLETSKQHFVCRQASQGSPPSAPSIMMLPSQFGAPPVPLELVEPSPQATKMETSRVSRATPINTGRMNFLSRSQGGNNT
jgi:hypothetical protein